MLASGQRLSVIGRMNWTGLAGPALLLSSLLYNLCGTKTRAPRVLLWRQRELGRVPDAQILFPQALKWANGAGPSRHFASQRKRSMRPRRSLHAFDSQEIGQQREEHLPAWEVSDGERTIYIVRGNV